METIPETAFVEFLNKHPGYARCKNCGHTGGFSFPVTSDGVPATRLDLSVMATAEPFGFYVIPLACDNCGDTRIISRQNVLDFMEQQLNPGVPE